MGQGMDGRSKRYKMVYTTKQEFLPPGKDMWKSLCLSHTGWLPYSREKRLTLVALFGRSCWGRNIRTRKIVPNHVVYHGITWVIMFVQKVGVSSSVFFCCSQRVVECLPTLEAWNRCSNDFKTLQKPSVLTEAERKQDEDNLLIHGSRYFEAMATRIYCSAL